MKKRVLICFLSVMVVMNGFSLDFIKKRIIAVDDIIVGLMYAIDVDHLILYDTTTYHYPSKIVNIRNGEINDIDIGRSLKSVDKKSGYYISFGNKYPALYFLQWNGEKKQAEIFQNEVEGVAKSTIYKYLLPEINKIPLGNMNFLVNGEARQVIDTTYYDIPFAFGNELYFIKMNSMEIRKVVLDQNHSIIKDVFDYKSNLLFPKPLTPNIWVGLKEYRTQGEDAIFYKMYSLNLVTMKTKRFDSLNCIGAGEYLINNNMFNVFDVMPDGKTLVYLKDISYKDSSISKHKVWITVVEITSGDM